MNIKHLIFVAFTSRSSIILILLVLFQYVSVAYATAATTEIKSRFNLQGIFYDKDSKLFTLERGYKNDLSMIFLNQENKRKLLIKDIDIGHQGFGVSTVEDNSELYLWTGKKKSGLNILLYKFKNEQKKLKYTIKLFPDDFTQNSETMPTLSSDGRYILARGRSATGQMFIRVFEVEKIYIALKNGDNIDFSNSYIYQWMISSKMASDAIGSLQPLQAIASNGYEVALLFGNARLTPKVIYFYTLDGQFKSIDANVTTGIKDAMVFAQQNFYEPEGLSYHSGILRILITYAKGVNKRSVVYDYFKQPSHNK
jgi:hypothetical protein